MIQKNRQGEDEIFNRNWDALLKVFHGISGTPAEKKTKYESLKEVAKNKPLSDRQREGIVERCNYQISLIDNADQKPFSNMLRDDYKRLELDKAKSNGKQQ